MQNRFGTKLVRTREIRTKERMRYVGMKRNILDTRSTAQTQTNQFSYFHMLIFLFFRATG